jgi:copper(I)-binding protein
MPRLSLDPALTLLNLLMLMLILAANTPALAEELRSGALTIEQPWARATPPVASAGAGYMILHNGADEADKLLSVSADVSEKVELHTHTMEDNVMMMREVEAIEIPAGAQVRLEPGGLHIMFIGLKGPLKEGSTFPLTLTFEKAGTATVDFRVYKDRPPE